MSNQFLGEIEFFAFAFAPKGWATCSGQLLPVNQNQALFSLLGTAFGGNGTTTFALPDLRGQIAAGQGQAPGSGNTYVVGESFGSESVSLAANQIPPHTHAVAAVGNTATVGLSNPGGNFLSVGRGPQGTVINTYTAGTVSGAMDPSTIGNAGTGQGHENRMPYLAMTPCIALVGSYPSRQ